MVSEDQSLALKCGQHRFSESCTSVQISQIGQQQIILSIRTLKRMTASISQNLGALEEIACFTSLFLFFVFCFKFWSGKLEPTYTNIKSAESLLLGSIIPPSCGNVVNCFVVRHYLLPANLGFRGKYFSVTPFSSEGWLLTFCLLNAFKIVQ